MNLRPYGPDAVLVEPDDPADVLGLASAARSLAGVVEVVPGARTLLVVLDRPHSGIDAALRGLVPEPVRSGGATVVLDVDYDGADLASTALELGLDADGLVRAHAAGAYTVAFCGFAPGFAYLTGLDAALHVPRLAEPRTRVPSGSVAIAGEFTGVYPRESPGGWRLLGHTDATLWDAERDPPALLSPGTRVTFRAR